VTLTAYIRNSCTICALHLTKDSSSSLYHIAPPLHITRMDNRHDLLVNMRTSLTNSYITSRLTDMFHHYIMQTLQLTSKA